MRNEMAGCAELQAWFEASKGALAFALDEEEMEMLEGAVRCAMEIEIVCPSGGALSSFCTLPHVMQCARDIRSTYEAVTHGLRESTHGREEIMRKACRIIR